MVMNNAHSVILRAVGCHFHHPFPFSRAAASILPFRWCSRSCHSFSSINCTQRQLRSRLLTSVPRWDIVHSSRTKSRTFETSSAVCALKVAGTDDDLEQGLAFRRKPLTVDELHHIFGGRKLPSLAFANRLMRVVHGRRIDGTLDLPLPPDMQPVLKRHPHAVEDALSWLREKYYVDEDAAIMARLDREEIQYDGASPSELQQRAQDIHTYSTKTEREPAQIQESVDRHDTYRGPQSGYYQAQLSQKGDVFGRSEFERIRAKNEAEAEQEEAELEKQIAGIQHRHEENQNQIKAVASRPEQGIEAAGEEFRPPNEFEKWVLRAKNRATSKLTLESEEIRDRSKIRRLLPSSIFLVVASTGLYAFTQIWSPPKRADRVMKEYSISFATVAGIAVVNLTVFCLWRFPPMWGLLNRYFLVVPATVKPLSLLGNIFSHTKVKHLLANMLPLLVFGPSLHEDLGRADFLALYLGSGLVGSYLSLVGYISRSVLVTSSLGASGCIWGVVGAYFNLHAHDRFTPWFLPEEMKESVFLNGWAFFSLLLSLEVVGVLTARLRNVDYVAHLGGAVTGWVFAQLWKENHPSVLQHGEFRAKTPSQWWHYFSPSNDKEKGA